MELTTTSTLSLFETDKAQRQFFVTDIINRIKEGEISPLKVHMQLKSAEDLLKQLSSDDSYKKLLLDEAEKHGKNFEMYNSKFQVKEAGTTYNYAVCEDSFYDDLCSQLTELKGKMKEREKFLQNIPESGIADPENGNMIYRATKSSTTTVAVTLK